jgi:hypothetical protein
MGLGMVLYENKDNEIKRHDWSIKKLISEFEEN